MRFKPLILAAAMLVASCTGSTPAGTPTGTPSLFLPTPTPTPGSSTGDQAGQSPGSPLGGALVILPVVATMTGTAAAEDQSYVDGMRLAVERIDASGGLQGRPVALEFFDDGGDVGRARDLIDQALDERPVSVLYVGPGEALPPLRLRFQDQGTPLILLSGDLYTSHELFPQVFQTAIPWEWQANVIARYLVEDRKVGQAVFVGAGPGARTAADATRSALAYWGGSLAKSITMAAGGPLDDAKAAAKGAAAVVTYGSMSDVARIAASLSGLRDAPRIAGPASLLSAEPHPAPGSVACSPYTWAGWAQPVPRVGAFRTEFAAATGRGVIGPEQEGYEAVRLLAWGLRRTDAVGGSKLVSQLEQAKGLTYAGFPIDLGPDDHVLPPRDQLGLFAVAGPDERVDPWQIPGADPWRAIMRTFTTDGSRTNIPDEDRTVFFPYWTKYLPGPRYWRSIYGISTRPQKDPLH